MTALFLGLCMRYLQFSQLDRFYSANCFSDDETEAWVKLEI